MNQLPGEVVSAASDGGVMLLEVTALGASFTALLLGPHVGRVVWTPGMPVQLLFKESEVSLAKGLSGLLSLRNRHLARVERVVRGALLSRVEMDFRGYRVVSIITTGSVARLELVPGDEVEWLVKANEMSVERG